MWLLVGGTVVVKILNIYYLYSCCQYFTKEGVNYM